MDDTQDRNDDLETLARNIVARAKSIDTAIQRQLVDIREFDLQRGWELHGSRSCAQWLSRQTGLGASAARERVRIAHALATLELVRSALAAGDISFSKVRAITRVATAENEAMLLSVAKRTSGAQLERFCRALRRTSSPTRAWEDCFVRRRTMADSGMVRIEIQLDSDKAATVWAALLAGARGAAAELEGPPTERKASSLPDALHRFAEQLLSEQGSTADRSAQAAPPVTDQTATPGQGSAAEQTPHLQPRRDDALSGQSACSVDVAEKREAPIESEGGRLTCGDQPHDCSAKPPKHHDTEHETECENAFPGCHFDDVGPLIPNQEGVAPRELASSGEPTESQVTRPPSSGRGDPPSVRG